MKRVTVLVIISAFMMNCVRENSESASAAEPTPVHYATTIDTMGNLLVFHPVYRHVDLVCGTMPSVGDSSVIYCAEAAFTFLHLLSSLIV